MFARDALSGTRAPWLVYLAGFLACLLLPYAGFSGFVVHQLQTFCYTAIAVIGLNLLLGFSGQMSLGHAGFFAIGAYGSAITSLKLNWPIYLSIPFGTALSFFCRRTGWCVCSSYPRSLPRDDDIGFWLHC